MADITTPGESFGPSDRFIVNRGGYVLVQLEASGDVSIQTPGASGPVSAGDDAVGTTAVVIGPVPGGTAITISASTAVAHVVKQRG